VVNAPERVLTFWVGVDMSSGAGGLIKLFDEETIKAVTPCERRLSRMLPGEIPPPR